MTPALLRCEAEIAALERKLREGGDEQGLLRALVDWCCERRLLLEREKATSGNNFGEFTDVFGL